ncbi:MAG: radical SAM/SPASM domain-containing protein [bacterium]|nr:radical SAM/SPASM domain-containing protein [bacterium]
MRYYKTFLHFKDTIKEKTAGIPVLHRGLLSAYRLYRKYSGKDIFHAIEIETTTVCNLRCSYCPVSISPRGKYFMESAVFKKIIDDLTAINYRGRIHPNWYGEPLADKRLPSFIAYAKARVPLAEIRIYTNGELLTVELFDALIEAGTDSFLITQHKNDMSENMKKVLHYIEDKPELQRRVTYRGLESDIVLRNRGGLIDNAATQGARNKCKAIGQMDVNYKGEVALCCDDYFSSVILGNVAEESVVDIWNTPSYRKAREQLEKGIPVFEICKKCNMLG